jgi:glycosyltransferase involved in cell wall biosynthesis
MIHTFEVLEGQRYHPARGLEGWDKRDYKLGRPLRVLQVGKLYHPEYGGMEAHLKSLCEGLQPTVEVEALVANNSPTNVVEDVDGVRVSRVGTLMRVSGASVCPGLAQKIRHSRADLLHIHLPNPTALLSWMASGNNAPVVMTYHSDIVRQKLLKNAFLPILNYALRRSSAIMVSSSEYAHTSPVLPAFIDKCQTVPFGIEVDSYDRCSPAAISEIRQRYGERIVLAVGRLVYYKGFEYLIRAMANVPGTLLIIGVGPLMEPLQRLAVAEGVSDRVQFLGRIDDVVPYYHACDVFAFPSVERSEAFGIAQLEAMACSRPVVNTRLRSGVPWVSVDGQTGITVKPKSVDELGRALVSLLSNPELCARYGYQARRRIETEFSRELMLRRTLEVYVDAIIGRQPQSLSENVAMPSTVFALARGAGTT